MASFSDTVGRSFARTRQGVLLGACFVILIAIAGAVTLLVEQASTDAQLVAHTLRVQDTLSALLILLIGGLSIYLVQRNYRAAETARLELENTNDNLERIVEFRTADLKEANDEIQRFAYIVSHDLRSPLVNIMGFTSELEALRKDLFDRVRELRKQLESLNMQVAEAATQGEQRNADELGRDFDEAIGFIKTSIGKMDRLINAVLKLSREGRREFHPESINMDAMIDSIMRTVAHRAGELNAEIQVGALPDVESDRLALEQIFSNLIDNAMKYLRDGVPGRVEISGRSNGVQVVYDVTDNGRGIDAADHQRVFELFRRAGVQDRPGEGIGLAHVRALVRRLGGHMTLKSEPGKGSTFTVALPQRSSVQGRSVA